MRQLAPLLFVVSLFAQACSCGPKVCAPGASGCPCKAADACDPGLLCGAGTCSPGTLVTLQPGDPAVRGCEVLLTEQPGTTVGSVVFGGGVVGTFVREAPRVALSFVAPGDAALPAAGVQVGITGPTAGLTVTKSSCVDGNAQKLPNAVPALR